MIRFPEGRRPQRSNNAAKAGGSETCARCRMRDLDTRRRNPSRCRPHPRRAIWAHVNRVCRPRDFVRWLRLRLSLWPRPSRRAARTSQTQATPVLRPQAGLRSQWQGKWRPSRTDEHFRPPHPLAAADGISGGPLSVFNHHTVTMANSVSVERMSIFGHHTPISQPYRFAL